MTVPNVSLLHGADHPVPASGPSAEGAAHLHLSGPVQVHVHFGPPPQAAAPALATSPRRHPVALALLGLALAGGGYLAGSRNAGAPVHADTSGASLADALPPAPGLLLPVPPAAPLPAQPARPGDIPPALQQQLARPGVVTPPSGAAAAPARNPFGLGN